MTSPVATTVAGEDTMAAADSAQARSAVRRRYGNSFRTRREIALFTGPGLLVYVGFVFVPVGLAVYYSFYKWNGVGPLVDFRGLDNYVKALGNANFRAAILHNFFFLVGSLVIQGPLAIALALMINRVNRGGAFFRLLIFAPYVLSEAIAAVAWRLLLSPQGAINSILRGLGLGDWVKTHDLLGTPSVTNWTVMILITWKYLGFAITLFLAGLQGIPEELSEAAQIDGATYWQTQFRITIPLLGPTIRIWAFLSIIGSLQLFDMPYLLNGGRPATGNQTMATMMMLDGQERHQFGYGSAMAVIMFLISLAVALLYQRFVLRRDTEGALTRGVN